MIDSGMIHTRSLETKRVLEDETSFKVRKLFFTHSHGDHVYGAQAFEPVVTICSEPMYNRVKKNNNGTLMRFH